MTYLVDAGRICSVLAKSPIDAAALATVDLPPVTRLVKVIEMETGTEYRYVIGARNDAIVH